MDIYRRACPEIQRIIASFFLPYERHGISKKVTDKMVSPNKSYYTRIRKCPHGWLLGGNQRSVYYYRRQDRYLQWKIQIRQFNKKSDIWHLSASTQFKQFSDQQNGILFRLIGRLLDGSSADSPYPVADSVYVSDYTCILCFIISPGESTSSLLPVHDGGSRQAYLSLFATMVRQLSQDSQAILQTLTQNRWKAS